MAKHDKSTFMLYVEYIPFLILYKFIHLLPLKLSYALASTLFSMLYYIAAKHRSRVISHLLHAKVAKNSAEAKLIARKFFQEFGKLLVEIVKMDVEYNPNKIHCVGTEKGLEAAFGANSKNFILVTAHYGNWEVAGTAISEKAKRHMVSIMRAFSNPLIGELILNHRRSKTHTVVPKDAGGMRALLKAIKDNSIATILIDQHAAHNEGVDTTFFGQPCKTHRTPALLHLKTGIPIIPQVTRRMNNNFEFELVMADPITHTPTDDKERDIQEIMQRCNNALEKLIAEQPEQWMWAHRRWTNINRKSSQHIS